MNAQNFSRFVSKFTKNFRTLTPIDTGNLRYNAVRYNFSSSQRGVVYIDTKIAPYMPFTDLPWLSPQWKGKKNPNEGWFERAVEKALEQTVKEMGGRIIKK